MMGRITFVLSLLSGMLLNPVFLAAQTESTPSEDGYVKGMNFLDADGDGKIGADELAAGQQMAAMVLALSWRDCDRNQDGAISTGEFSEAADRAMQELLTEASEENEQAQEALAEAVPLSLLLENLAQNERYSDEVAALRAEIENLNDDEEVITYLIENPHRYPYLAPVVRTWARYYPVRAGLRKNWRYAKSAWRTTRAKSTPGRAPRSVKPRAAKSARPARAPKARPARRAGNPRRR